MPATLAPGLSPAPDADQEASLAVFGDLLVDPVLVEIMRAPLAEPVPAENVEIEIQGLTEMLAQAPEGTRVETAPERFQAGDRPAVAVVYAAENGLALERVVALETGTAASPAAVLRIDVTLWPRYRAAYRDLARRIAASLAPLAQP